MRIFLVVKRTEYEATVCTAHDDETALRQFRREVDGSPLWHVVKKEQCWSRGEHRHLVLRNTIL